MDWFYGLFFLCGIGCLLFITESLRKRFREKVDITRKLVHILTGVFIAVTPFLFTSKWPIISIAALFISFNYFAIKRDIIKSIHNTPNRSYGTVYYPLAFLILTYLLWDRHKVILVSSFLVLSLADAFAAIVGERLKRPLTFRFGTEKKSVQGSLVMWIFSTVIVFVCIRFLGFIDHVQMSSVDSLWIALIVGIVATACETVSFKGSDNFSVPLGAAFSMHFMMTHHPHNEGFTLGLILALFIAVISFRLKFLDGGGSVATFLLGVLVFGTGGWKFSLPILSFFILSSILSKLGKYHKQKLSEKFQKSSRRDLWQVLANGGIGGLLVLVWNYYPNEIFYYLFAGSVAAANSDTWGTEIGVFSKTPPRHILNFKSVPVGSSGGVSLLGTSGAFLGSLVIALVAAMFIKTFSLILIIAVSGFIGSIIDSLVGATIQAQYLCPVCGKITEKMSHCEGHETRRISGWKWVDNDVVNTICTIGGATVTWLGIKCLI